MDLELKDKRLVDVDFVKKAVGWAVKADDDDVRNEKGGYSCPNQIQPLCNKHQFYFWKILVSQHFLKMCVKDGKICYCYFKAELVYQTIKIYFEVVSFFNLDCFKILRQFS